MQAIHDLSVCRYCRSYYKTLAFIDLLAVVSLALHILEKTMT
jgi:hypothetical protein